MPGLPYTLPDDDYIPTLVGTSPAGLTFSGTVDSEYPIEKIGNLDPSDPFRTVDTTVTIAGDLGSAQPIGLLVIVQHNLAAGLSPSGVQLQLDDNSSFTSPETFPITVPAAGEDGQPTNILLDLVATGAGVKTYRYFRFQVTSANAGGVQIGEMILAPGWRELDAYWQAGVVDDEFHPLIENPSDGGRSTRYEHLYRPQFIRGPLMLTSMEETDSVDEPLRRWNRAARGRARPFLINTILPIREAWYVLFEKDGLPRARVFQDEATDAYVHTYQLGFEVCPKGLAP